MDPRLARIVRAQAGMFTRTQALSCGYSPERIRTELKNRRWFVVVDGVYRLVGSPGGWNARVWAALLAAGDGAVLGGRPAGRLHRIDGVPAYERLAVVVPRNRRPRLSAGALVERSPLSRADVAHQRGIPVLSPARTVVDLARRESLDVAVRIVGDAIRHRGRVAVPNRRRRRASSTAVRGIPPRNLRCPARLRDRGVAPRAEADGYGVHSLRPAFERDREPNAILQLAGWIVLSFTAEQIRRRPDWVQDAIRRMVARRRAELSEVGDAWCG